jgi:CHASE3 domain sensor protein
MSPNHTSEHGGPEEQRPKFLRQVRAKLSSWLKRLSSVPFFPNLNIGPRLTIGFGILVALTFISAGVSYLGSRRATNKIQLTDEVRVPVALAAANAQANLLRMQADVRGYLALGDERYQTSYNQSDQAFQANLAELERMLKQYSDRENLVRLARIQYHYDEWSTWPPQLFELRNDQLEREPAYRLLATDGIRFAGRVLIDTNSLIEAQGQREPTTENLTLLQDMAQFQGNFAAMLSALRGYVATRNAIFRDYEYEVNLISNDLDWQQLQDKRQLLTPSQQAQLDSIAANRDDFLDLPPEIFEILESDRYREDLYLFTENAVPHADTMQELFNEMTTDQQLQLTTELAEGRRVLNLTNQEILAGGVIALVSGLGLAFVLRTNIAGPVQGLTAVAERIRSGDLAARADVTSNDEIGTLAETFNNMTSQLSDTLLQVRKEKQRADDLLEVVIPIGIELASEKNFNLLLEKMLLEAKTFCRADAGTLYLLNENRELEFVIVRNDSQQLALGGTTEQAVPYDPLPLTADGEHVGQGRVAVQVAATGKSANVVEDDTPGIMTEAYDVRSMLAIPLKNTGGDVLGVLQLINAQDPETLEVVPFDQNLQQMMESFSSLAVAALEAYIREQRLRNQIQQLRIEIDEAKKERQVAEITESDYFQQLRERARTLREQAAE